MNIASYIAGEVHDPLQYIQYIRNYFEQPFKSNAKGDCNYVQEYLVNTYAFVEKE